MSGVVGLALVGCGLTGCGPRVGRPESLTAPAAFPDVSTVVSHRNATAVSTAVQWRASTNGHVLFSDSISEPCVGALTSCWLSTPSALPLPGAAGTDVLVAFQPSGFSDRPLVLRMHRRDGPVLWQRSLPASGLIGAADVLGTGRADLVVVVGSVPSTVLNPVGSPGRLAFLDENSGETIFERPLPNDIQSVNLAPSLTAGGRTASVVLITDDYGPPRGNDFVTALTGPTLRPLWTTDLGGFPANLTCCGFGASTQHPSGSGVVYVPVDDPAGDLTGDGVPELLMTHGHGGPLILDGATGRQLLYQGGGPTEAFFVLRAARPGQSGLIAFTGEQFPSDLGFGLWVYDGTGQLVWHIDKLGGSVDVGDFTGDGTDDIATVEFTQFGATLEPGRHVVLDGATGRPLTLPAIPGVPVQNQFLQQLGPITLNGRPTLLTTHGAVSPTFEAYDLRTGRQMWQAPNPGTIAVLSTQRCGLLQLTYYNGVNRKQPPRALIAIVNGNGLIRWIQGPDGGVQPGPGWNQFTVC